MRLIPKIDNITLPFFNGINFNNVVEAITTAIFDYEEEIVSRILTIGKEHAVNSLVLNVIVGGYSLTKLTGVSCTITLIEPYDCNFKEIIFCNVEIAMPKGVSLPSSSP